ncbi:MAG: hypothetical protein IJ147_03270 [Lachnospiraceae bacterium]|nr:hypothetical protein [Lachnospiraceae bacterium]
MSRKEVLVSLDFGALRDVDIRTVQREELAEIGDVQIDSHAPLQERFADFMRQVKNPYCYRCGKVVVKVSFADTEKTLEDRIEQCVDMFR